MPINTAFAELQLDSTATDIQSLAAQAAGASGRAADAKHIHPGRDYYMRDSSILGETMSRLGQLNSNFALVSGTLQMTAMYLPANITIGHLATCNGTASLSGATHWWFGLYDSSLNQLAVTADQTSASWTLNTYKSLAVATIASGASTTFTTTYTGLHYFGIMTAWTTTGTSIIGVSQTSTGVTGQSPVLCGASDTGQTTPPAFPHTATSITASTNPLYAAVAT